MGQLLELNHRKSDGLDVTLLWDEDKNSVLIGLQDRTKDIQDLFVVPSDHAMDAFWHPYSYYEG